MTADFIAFHAAERPDAVAFIQDGRTIGYAELSRDVRALTRALRALGLARGNTVAVGCDHIYAHWVLLLACEELCVASASFQSTEGSGCAPLLASVDLVLAEPHFPTEGARRHHAITQEWWRGALGLPVEGEEPPPLKAPDDPMRIVRTSGTTGTSKRFFVLRAIHEAVIAQWSWGVGLTGRSRYWVTLPLVVRAVYDIGTACLRLGGTIVVESRMHPREALTAHAVTHAILLPVNLKVALDGLPPDFAKPPDLTILSFGAPVTPALRERATARLATAVYDLYGSVEIAAVCSTARHDTGGFGTLLPGVQVEVVDDRGNPLPYGEIGQIRAKTERMFEGYLDDPETTRRMLRDGWFYPGDVGILEPGRRLKVMGRMDDLLNIGGNKFLPSTLEELLLGHEVAGDAGVCSIQNADGIEQVCVAVSDARGSDREILERIARAFQNLGVGEFYLIKMDHIPRNASGKIQRNLLKEAADSRKPAR